MDWAGVGGGGRIPIRNECRYFAMNFEAIRSPETYQPASRFLGRGGEQMAKCVVTCVELVITHLRQVSFSQKMDNILQSLRKGKIWFTLYSPNIILFLFFFFSFTSLGSWNDCSNDPRKGKYKLSKQVKLKYHYQ